MLLSPSRILRRILPLHVAAAAPGLFRQVTHPLSMSKRRISDDAPTTAMADTEGNDYAQWTRESLVKRIKALEEDLQHRNNKDNASSELPQPEPAVAVASTSSTQPLPPPLLPAVIPQAETAPEDGTGGAQPPPKKRKKAKRIDPSKYSTRVVAIKLAYLGKNYGGFEYQSSAALPTIETELWKALVKSCLIIPPGDEDSAKVVDFGPFEYAKCGRTDRGVSAFGQVINIRVRSNRPLPKAEETAEGEASEEGAAAAAAAALENTAQGAGGEAMDVDDAASGARPEKAKKDKKPKRPFDDVADELPYCRILNKLLPPDIRALAWAPHLPADFSARFSCRERQYRYFFTQPAFTPAPTLPGAGTGAKDGWLDIDAMRAAAKLFEGEHDFRNYCKVDGAKQLTNFTRRMFEADIVEVEDVESALPYLGGQAFRPEGVDALAGAGKLPKVYYFHVRGSAFLWHQIRHMVAILFLVGQGLEKPSIVTDLLDIQKHPQKPSYIMADETPLVLWDCIFPPLDGKEEAAGGDSSMEGEEVPRLRDAIDWVWLGEDNPAHLYGASGLVDDLWEQWRERKMDELLANRLLDFVSGKADLSKNLGVPGPKPLLQSQRVFEGGNTARFWGTYVPVLQKPLLPTPEVANDKWAQRKGFASAKEMVDQGNWRNAIKAAKNKPALPEGVEGGGAGDE